MTLITEALMDVWWCARGILCRSLYTDRMMFETYPLLTHHDELDAGWFQIFGATIGLCLWVLCCCCLMPLWNTHWIPFVSIIMLHGFVRNRSGDFSISSGGFLAKTRNGSGHFRNSSVVLELFTNSSGKFRNSSAILTQILCNETNAGSNLYFSSL